MLSIKDKIRKLTGQLFPTGRAFNILPNSIKDKYFNAVAEVEAEAYNEALGILNSILPDNDDFTVDDAARWEEALGMIDGTGVSLVDRKAAIIRKMNYPGTIVARQSAGFLEQSLQLANFDVYVHENLPASSIESVLNAALGIVEMGVSEMGDNSEMGSSVDYYSDLFRCAEMGVMEMGDGLEMNECSYTNIIANYINEELDKVFDLPVDTRSLFFVGGQDLGTFANVDINRKEEFRQLILRIKPVRSIAVLFINYV